MEHTQKHENGFMVKLATFIVDKRSLFFLITIIALIFSAFSRNWVVVENDLSFYLPDDAETKLALDVMEDQFTTYGTAEVVVANITYEEAEALNDRISEVKGVQSVAFDQTTDHYASSSALFTVTFDYDETDDACLTSLDAVKALLSDYELYISTGLGDTLAETIDSEVSVIMVKEAALLDALDGMDGIDDTMGLANVEAMDGYMLADKLTPRQFSELAGLDYEMAQVVYAAYATEQGDYGKLMGNISSYKVPLMDMFLFVCDQVDADIVQLDADQTAMLQDAKTQMESARAQLQDQLPCPGKLPVRDQRVDGDIGSHAPQAAIPQRLCQVVALQIFGVAAGVEVACSKINGVCPAPDGGDHALQRAGRAHQFHRHERSPLSAWLP